MKKTIIITGAGTGIGQSIAIELDKNNDHHLVLIGRRKSELEKTIHMLKNKNHVSVSLDVKNVTEWKKFSIDFKSILTNCYAVIAAAGIGGENNYGEQDRWDEIINTNLTGSYHTGSTFIPFLKTSPHPYKHIILVSSILAHLGVPNYSAYCASKAGLLGLMRSWAQELAANNILVNAICPGWVETEMAKTGIAQFATHMGITANEAKDQQMQFVPLKKMATPEEIALFVKYLLDERQTSFTGETFNLNNGALML